MFVTTTLDELERQRRALLARSTVQRAILELEIVRLRPYLGYVETGVNFVKKARPVWMIAGPLLGFWAARRLRKTVTWLPAAFLGWRTIQKGMALWRKFQSDSPSDTAVGAVSTE